jgi:hypothetical protein
MNTQSFSSSSVYALLGNEKTGGIQSEFARERRATPAELLCKTLNPHCGKGGGEGLRRIFDALRGSGIILST